MINLVKSLKNGQIQRNVEKYFVSRKVKNEKKIVKKCEKW